MPRKMPAQRPGKSETVVQTPDDFIRAVKSMLGIKKFAVDLAASDDNAQARNYWTKEEDSLQRAWYLWLDTGDWAWLNPPYDRIELWVKKCVEEAACSGVRIAVLVPASTGSNWWAKWVDGHADIRLLNGRITFVGHDHPYPKDLALLLYGTGYAGYSVWRWRDSLPVTKRGHK